MLGRNSAAFAAGLAAVALGGAMVAIALAAPDVDAAFVIAAAAGAVALSLTSSTAFAMIAVRRQFRDIAHIERETLAAIDRMANMIAARDQAWFWTPEWQAGEHEADEEIAAGKLVGPMDPSEFERYLDQLDLEASQEQAIGSRVA